LNRVTDTVGTFLTSCHAQLQTSNTTDNAQLAQWCDGKSGMCMAINIPSTTSADYYMAITAPDSTG